MIYITHNGKLTNQEKSMISALIEDSDTIKFDEESEHLPLASLTVGGEIIIPLAYLVIGLVGSSAAILLKSFLEGFGKKAGEKLLEHFFEKAKKDKGDALQLDLGGEEKPLYPVSIVYEIRPDLLAVILLSSPDDAAFAKTAEILSLIAEAATKYTEPGLIVAVFKQKTQHWEISFDTNYAEGVPSIWEKEREGPAGFIVTLDHR